MAQLWINRPGADRRDEVLGAVRRSLGVRGDEAGRRGQVRTRLERPPPALTPARARQDRPELIALFCEMLQSQGAETVFTNWADIPEAAAERLLAAELPQRLRAGADPLIVNLPWSDSGLEIVRGAAAAADRAAVSRALAGAAETGALFLASGPDNPSTLNFLPELHFIVIAETDILGSYEDAWAKIRAAYGKRCMPRTVNLISGHRADDCERSPRSQRARGPRGELMTDFF
jgi:L-lactate dehydrogenase complex protein LldG